MLVARSRYTQNTIPRNPEATSLSIVSSLVGKEQKKKRLKIAVWTGVTQSKPFELQKNLRVKEEGKGQPTVSEQSVDDRQANGRRKVKGNVGALTKKRTREVEGADVLPLNTLSQRGSPARLEKLKRHR